MADFSYTELRDCAGREVKQRDRVYPRLIASGKMTQEFARRERRMMKAIFDHMDELAKSERLL